MPIVIVYIVHFPLKTRIKASNFRMSGEQIIMSLPLLAGSFEVRMRPLLQIACLFGESHRFGTELSSA